MRALRDAPYAFMSSLEREAAHDPEFWEQWVGESDLGVAGAIFVAIDDGAGVAMAGGFFADDARETATLWGMWVDPAARRRGLGRQLVDAVADWARRSGAASLRLAVTECPASQPAAALYQGLGFVHTGEQEQLESDPTLTTQVMTLPI
jgi:GNAT superfamily N-acetyltransferase